MADTINNVCGAPTKNGDPCPRHREAGSGGEGRWSETVPPRLRGRYECSVNDRTQLELRHEIALVDARLDDLLQRVATGESSEAWKRLQKLFAEVQKALDSKDVDKVKLKAEALGSLIAEGADDDAAWEAVLTLIDQRYKLVEGEQKRLTNGKMMLRVDEATAFMDAMIQSVRLHVKDSDILAAISADFARLTA